MSSGYFSGHFSHTVFELTYCSRSPWNTQWSKTEDEQFFWNVSRFKYLKFFTLGFGVSGLLTTGIELDTSLVFVMVITGLFFCKMTITVRASLLSS